MKGQAQLLFLFFCITFVIKYKIYFNLSYLKSFKYKIDGINVKVPSEKNPRSLLSWRCRRLYEVIGFFFFCFFRCVRKFPRTFWMFPLVAFGCFLFCTMRCHKLFCKFSVNSCTKFYSQHNGKVFLSGLFFW